MTVALVAARDRVERFEALGARLADADEDPGRERHAREPGRLERRQPPLGCLVGRTVMRAAGLAEAGRERLDHHPLRRRPAPEPFELFARERAGVGVGEQAGLGDDQLAHRDEVVDRRRVAVLREPGPGLRVAGLGRLAEGEQHLVASGRGAAAGRSRAPRRA